MFSWLIRFTLNESSYSTNNSVIIGSKIILLGILFAAPQISVDGNIKIKEIPTQQIAIPNVNVMCNLGYYIKANELLAFKPIIESNLQIASASGINSH